MFHGQIHNTVQGKVKLWKFLDAVVPDEVPYDKDGSRTQRREDLLKDVVDGVDVATMAIRVAFVHQVPISLVHVN